MSISPNSHRLWNTIRESYKCELSEISECISSNLVKYSKFNYVICRNFLKSTIMMTELGSLWWAIKREFANWALLWKSWLLRCSSRYLTIKHNLTEKQFHGDVERSLFFKRPHSTKCIEWIFDKKFLPLTSSSRNSFFASHSSHIFSHTWYFARTLWVVLL
jgi:hypothetical protein